MHAVRFFYVASFLLWLSAAGVYGQSGTPEIVPPKSGQSSPSGKSGKKDKTSPRFIEADRVEGIVEKRITAEGNVVIHQSDMKLTADQIDYEVSTDTARATGDVQLESGSDVASGTELQLKLDSEVGFLDQPQFLFSKQAGRRHEAHGSARRMEFEGAQKKRLFNAEYTTCKPGENEWFLRMGELALDHERSVGTGYNGVVEFKGVPIIYVPYMTFPLDNNRKSGFLPPLFGSSSQSGLDLALPYYFNLAPNRDWTLTPKIFTRRGLQLGSEFRYLEPHYLGQWDAEYLPSDRIASRDRHFVRVVHAHNLDSLIAPGWTASINAQRVSDDAYFRELSTRITNTAQINLPRDVALNYSSEWGGLNLRHLSYQTLQDPLAPVITPYRLAPQISFIVTPQHWQGFEFSGVGEFTDFRHPALVNGQRLLIYPSAAYKFNRPYGYLLPKLGYHITHYKLGENSVGYENKTRTLPIASLDSGVAFEKPLTFNRQSYTQTLEPRLFYLYVPYRDQSKLPVFSTAQTDFNFSQIFNENLFIGGDRISDAKQVTAALTTRFIENATGIERLRGAIAQRYYYSAPRVALAEGLPSNNDGASGKEGSRSDLLAGLSGQISDAWNLDSLFQYSTSHRQFEKSNLALRYNPQGGKIVNFSYRFTRDTLKQVDVSTQWPFGRIAPGWTLLARANHSLRHGRLLEGLLGVEYNQGCWELRMVAHRFTTSTNVYSNSIQIQLELKGLSKIGINPLETLRQNISGYRQSDELLSR